MPNAKTCSKCGEEKPLDAFPKRKDAKDGYRNDCRACNHAAQAAYREAKKEYLASKKRERYEAQRDKILQARREFRKRERDRLNEVRRKKRAEDPEPFRAVQRASWARRRERMSAERRGRRFRRRQVKLDALLARDGNVCGICGHPLGDIALAHVDHIYPRSLGGSDDMSNLQLAHAFCNQSKQARITQQPELVRSLAS